MFGMIGSIIKGLLGNNPEEKITAIKGLVETIAANKDMAKKPKEKKFINIEDELIATAMIEAAKADGVVTENEMNTLIHLLETECDDKETFNYLLDILKQPINMDKVVSLAKDNKELAIKAYSSTLMLIHNPNERELEYLDKLAKALGLRENIKKIIETNI